MIGLFFSIGLAVAFLGALPLGASNIAVINTSIKQNINQASKIIFASGFAEVILSYYALHCNLIVTNFFENNLWLQIVIALVLFGVGLLLYFKSQHNNYAKPWRLRASKYVTGFFLGLLNPPVLIYWIVAFSLINNSNLMLSYNSPILTLIFFFFGVYLGKVFALYLYGKFSILIKNRIRNVSMALNKLTGVLLIIIALFQGIKIYAL
jgi:threonine/homoserine/homoserine lactone efflux protein